MKQTAVKILLFCHWNASSFNSVHVEGKRQRVKKRGARGPLRLGLGLSCINTSCTQLACCVLEKDFDEANAMQREAREKFDEQLTQWGRNQGRQLCSRRIGSPKRMSAEKACPHSSLVTTKLSIAASLLSGETMGLPLRSLQL